VAGKFRSGKISGGGKKLNGICKKGKMKKKIEERGGLKPKSKTKGLPGTLRSYPRGGPKISKGGGVCGWFFAK